jgi:hypothetical protein
VKLLKKRTDEDNFGVSFNDFSILNEKIKNKLETKSSRVYYQQSSFFDYVKFTPENLPFDYSLTSYFYFRAFTITDIPQQENQVDCGIYSLLCIELFLKYWFIIFINIIHILII